MKKAAPGLVALEPDDSHAQHVGRTKSGQQFFLTTPFVPHSPGNAGCEYVALYIFDAAGKLIESKIDSFGPRPSMNHQKRKDTIDLRLYELGKISRERIMMQPFTVEHEGVTFGLVATPPAPGDKSWVVDVEPGNYMAFFEPWDSGVYET